MNDCVRTVQEGADLKQRGPCLECMRQTGAGGNKGFGDHDDDDDGEYRARKNQQAPPGKETQTHYLESYEYATSLKALYDKLDLRHSENMKIKFVINPDKSIGVRGLIHTPNWSKDQSEPAMRKCVVKDIAGNGEVTYTLGYDKDSAVEKTSTRNLILTLDQMA